MSPEYFFQVYCSVDGFTPDRFTVMTLSPWCLTLAEHLASSLASLSTRSGTFSRTVLQLALF